MAGARFTDRQKDSIDQDKKVAANYLYWEEKLPQYKIETQLKIGQATFDKLLLPTFSDWLNYRNRLGK